MKSPAILIGVIAVIAVAIGAILFTDDQDPGYSSSMGPSGSAAIASTNPVDRSSESGPSLAKREAEGEVPTPTASVRTAIKNKQPKQAASASTEIKGPFLRGEVRDSNGYTVAGAEIKLTGEGPAATLMNLTGTPFVQRTVTDSTGGFKVTRRGLLSSELTAYVSARGYQHFELECEPDTESGDGWLGEMVLERGVVIGGRVFDSVGDPVVGAPVQCIPAEREGRFRRSFMFGGADQGRVETDQAGYFEFGHEAPGALVVQVDHEAYPKGRLVVTAPFAGFEDTSFVLRLEEEGSIKGKLSGMPLGRRDVRVSAVPSEFALNSDGMGAMSMFLEMSGRSENSSALVNPDGSFEILGLHPSQNYEVMATTVSGLMQQVRCSDRKLVEGDADNVQLEWDAGARIAFKLVDGATGKPVTTSTVNYQWELTGDFDFRMGTSKSEFKTSHVEISELRPGEELKKLSLMITSPGYLELKQEDIPVAPDTLVDLGTIQLTKAPLVRVHVIDAGSGKGLRRGRVSLMPEGTGSEDEGRRSFGFGSLTVKGNKARTERDGWAELSACASETATLKVLRSGYADYIRKGVAMPLGGQIEVTVEMVKGSTLNVLIVDTKGDPVGKAEIEYEGPGDVKGKSVSSNKGRLKLKELAPGVYRMKAERPKREGGLWYSNGQGKGIWISKTVGAGTTEDLTMTVPLETWVEGVVTWNGAPAKGAEIEFVGGDGLGGKEMSAGRWSDSESDSKGAYRLGGLIEGSHRLSVNLGPGAVNHTVRATLVEGRNLININLDGGEISGRVVDEDGRGIPRAEVFAHEVAVSEGPEEMAVIGQFFGGNSSGHRTDSDGRFTIDGLPDGTKFKLSGEASGFVETYAEGEFETGSTGIELALKPSSSLEVLVTGNGSDFTYVEARMKEDSSEREGEVAVGNKTTLRDLKPGVWIVNVAGLGRGDDGPEVEVLVEIGQPAVVTVARP